MNLALRTALADSPLLVMQDPAAQRRDLLAVDGSGLQAEAASGLAHLLSLGYGVELTAVRSDHSDDTHLSADGPPWPGTHAHGWAFDCWLLAEGNVAGVYEDASSARFRAWLTAVSRLPWLRQVGLRGDALPGDDAESAANFAAAGPTAFHDDGGAHVHVGFNP